MESDKTPPLNLTRLELAEMLVALSRMDTTGRPPTLTTVSAALDRQFPPDRVGLFLNSSVMYLLSLLTLADVLTLAEKAEP